MDQIACELGIGVCVHPAARCRLPDVRAKPLSSS
jgi:hypothetical protein